MTEQNLKLIGTIPKVPQYETQADFFIRTEPSGERLLVVRYQNGGHEGLQEFRSEIPDDWTEAEVLDLIFWPTKPGAPFPAWEIPARAFASFALFRWWKGEKPS
jgi:hypothetical protein